MKPYVASKQRSRPFLLPALVVCTVASAACEDAPPDPGTPKVKFSSLTDRALIGGDPLTTTVEANDPDGIVLVRLFLDDQLVAEKNTGPYSLSWSTTSYNEGDHTLRAVASDSTEVTGEVSINVRVDNTPPQVQLTRTSNPGQTPTELEFEVSENEKLAALTVGDRMGFSVTLTDPPYIVSLDAGCYAELVATVQDAAGWSTETTFYTSLIDSCDQDCDSYRSAACGGDDCNDYESGVYSGAPDTPDDGRDQSCDGIDGMDSDRDGVAAGAGDCNDEDPESHGAGVRWESMVLTATIGGGKEYAVLPGGDRVIIYGQDAKLLAARASEGWAPKLLAEGDDVFLFRPVIGWNAAGQVAIAYSSGQRVWIAREVQGEWRSTAVSRTSEQQYGGLALALDPSGHAFVAYMAHPANSYSRVIVADDTSGAWRWQELDPNETTSLYFSRSGDGALYLGYGKAGRDTTPYKFRRWRLGSAGWTMDIDRDLAGIDSAVQFCMFGNEPVFAFLRYRSDNDWAVFVARRRAGAWEDRQVATDPSSLHYELRCGREGVHLLYKQGNYWNLRYGTDTAGAWLTNVSPVVDSGVAATVDSAGDLRILMRERDGSSSEYRPRPVASAADTSVDGVDQNCDGRDGPLTK